LPPIYKSYKKLGQGNHTTIRKTENGKQGTKNILSFSGGLRWCPNIGASAVLIFKKENE
jgi:hypothetical protein